jgi:hypothetical protein
LPSFLKLARQDRLDAMDLGRHVSGGQSGNLCDRGGIKSLEIGENHVPVERLQALDEL